LHEPTVIQNTFTQWTFSMGISNINIIYLKERKLFQNWFLQIWHKLGKLN